MSIGQVERTTQNRIVSLFQSELGYTYLGNWEERSDNSNIKISYLRAYLTRAGYSEVIIDKALYEFTKVAGDQSKWLYDLNKEVYSMLRYGVKVRADIGENHQTVALIDWKHPENNDFAIAEEVSIQGENKKRPDIVIFVNGITLGVIELKRSTVSVSEGIRQNLDNQKEIFIKRFFSTIQLIMAGNDTEWVRYGTIETPEKYYLAWKELSDTENLLDRHIMQLCDKSRFLELIHDFIVFDAGIKKLCRTHQYFWVKKTQERIKKREGGIIWHSQGSGKSLTMVWLAKWIRENVTASRVLIITDRTELDEQIEKVFKWVDEDIYRISKKNAGVDSGGKHLIDKLNETSPWLLCSLIHKFGNKSETDDVDYDNFIEDIKN